jgi:hypothetical protein
MDTPIEKLIRIINEYPHITREEILHEAKQLRRMQRQLIEDVWDYGKEQVCPRRKGDPQPCESGDEFHANIFIYDL